MEVTCSEGKPGKTEDETVLCRTAWQDRLALGVGVVVHGCMHVVSCWMTWHCEPQIIRGSDLITIASALEACRRSVLLPQEQYTLLL